MLYPFELRARERLSDLILQRHCNCSVCGFADSRAQVGHRTASSDSSARRRILIRRLDVAGLRYAHVRVSQDALNYHVLNSEAMQVTMQDHAAAHASPTRTRFRLS